MIEQRESAVKFGGRVIFIAVWPLLSALAIIWGRSSLSTFPEETAHEIISATRLLGAISILYLGNYLVAWRHASSWTITMTRLLIWAVLAFFFLSGAIDLLGENWYLSSELFGLDAAVDNIRIAELRLRLVFFILPLCLCLVCIAVGFEPHLAKDEAKAP